MHPEIVTDAPGRCPKCGMQLVPAAKENNYKPAEDKGLGELTWQNYIPLIVIISIISAITLIISWTDYQAGVFSVSQSISYFMISFFVAFSAFKLMDLRGFAEGYSTYDLLAGKIFAYGYVYPFIELGFGLAMLAGIKSNPLLVAEVVVMGFSGWGVLRKVMLKEPVKCVCLGTFLKVPLTNITLIEDFGMVALALILLFLK